MEIAVSILRLVLFGLGSIFMLGVIVGGCLVIISNHEFKAGWRAFHERRRQTGS